MRFYQEPMKKPALSQWENSDTLKHGYHACFCKTLILYGYSIADAPQKVKTRSGSFIIIQKMGRPPPKHHSAAYARRTYNPWDRPTLPASPPQRMQCCSLAAPRPAARLRVSRRAHKQSMMVSLYHNIQILSMLALISYLLDLCRTVGILRPLSRRSSLTYSALEYGFILSAWPGAV